jgi:hypothetical protein
MEKNNFARNKKEVTPATEVINSTQQTQTTPSQDLLSPITNTNVILGWCSVRTELLARSLVQSVQSDDLWILTCSPLDLEKT